MMAHHRRAGTRGHHDRPGLGEQVELAACDGARLVGIAAGVCRLAAAGLVGGKVDRDAFALEQADGIESGFGGELVDQAGREKIGVAGFRRVRPGATAIGFHDTSSVNGSACGNVVLPFTKANYTDRNGPVKDYLLLTDRGALNTIKWSDQY